MVKKVSDKTADPMEFMSFLAHAPVRLCVKAMTTGTIIDEGGNSRRENYLDARADLSVYLEAEANGRFMVLLGNESSEFLTDDFCQLSVCLEDPADEAVVLRAYERFGQ